MLLMCVKENKISSKKAKKYARKRSQEVVDLIAEMCGLQEKIGSLAVSAAISEIEKQETSAKTYILWDESYHPTFSHS